MSKVVEHSLFISLKVPLSEAYEVNLKAGEKANFSVQCMQDALVAAAARGTKVNGPGCATEPSCLN